MHARPSVHGGSQVTHASGSVPQSEPPVAELAVDVGEVVVVIEVDVGAPDDVSTSSSSVLSVLHASTNGASSTAIA